MTELDCQQIINYFHRCYQAVDGLWFMKVEEKIGFDSALDVDHEVWKLKFNPKPKPPTGMCDGKY